MAKIKTKRISLEEFDCIDENDELIEPIKQNQFLKIVIKLLYKHKLKNIKLNNVPNNIKNTPCIYIMNHCGFIDFPMAFKLIPNKFNIVTNDDVFIGMKKILMKLGCFSTYKYDFSPRLIVDSIKILKDLKQSILIYPEAQYSSNGLSSTLPPQFGKFLKSLNVPVIMIKSKGNYLYQPLFNNIINKNVKLSAEFKCLFSSDDLKNKSDLEITEIINNEFSKINYYDDQIKENIIINNKNRALHLDRILYKCPHCGKEFEMVGKGNYIYCKNCNEKYYLLENGTLKRKNGNSKFHSIPEWCNWERSCVKQEIINNTYNEVAKCRLYAYKNYSCLYDLQTDIKIRHNKEKLSFIVNKEEFNVALKNRYSINTDINFYQYGPMISIGYDRTRYIAILKEKEGLAYKAKIASEESYRLSLKENC